jgi:hypothetical protein
MPGNRLHQFHHGLLPDQRCLLMHCTLVHVLVLALPLAPAPTRSLPLPLHRSGGCAGRWTCLVCLLILLLLLRLLLLLLGGGYPLATRPTQPVVRLQKHRLPQCHALSPLLGAKQSVLPHTFSMRSHKWRRQRKENNDSHREAYCWITCMLTSQRQNPITATESNHSDRIQSQRQNPITATESNHSNRIQSQQQNPITATESNHSDRRRWIRQHPLAQCKPKNPSTVP